MLGFHKTACHTHRVRRISLIFVCVLFVGACGINAGSPDQTVPVVQAAVDTGQDDPTDGADSTTASSTSVVPASSTSSEATTTSSSAPTTTIPPTTTTTIPPGPMAAEQELVFVDRITGDIAPKSVVHSGDGLFFAQNMMYRHTVTVYNRDLELVATLTDTVGADLLGLDGDATYQGSPVEAAFTSDGRYGYVSNYQMYGPSYGNAGGDSCNNAGYDESFVYRIDAEELEIDQAIAVGAVPKFVAVTPDDRFVLVTNWCTFDLSIIDVDAGVEIGRVELGRHPRGIAVTADSATAYVAVMGSSDVAVVSLDDRSVEWFEGVGPNPRHLVLSPDDATLYVTLNGAGNIAAVDTATGDVIGTVSTGRQPRTMVISDDGSALYVVNYGSDTVAKVATADLSVLQELPVPHLPIGITFDPEADAVWVSSYSGAITVFREE